MSIKVKITHISFDFPSFGGSFALSIWWWWALKSSISLLSRFMSHWMSGSRGVSCRLRKRYKYCMLSEVTYFWALENTSQ